MILIKLSTKCVGQGYAIEIINEAHPGDYEFAKLILRFGYFMGNFIYQLLAALELWPIVVLMYQRETQAEAISGHKHIWTAVIDHLIE